MDYILINKIWINGALNYEAYSSFEGLLSYHRIVTAKIHLSLCRNTTQRTKTTHYDWSLPNNRNIWNRYTIRQRNKFFALQEISETLAPNDEYENFVHANMEAAVECILNKQRAKHRVPWETLTVRKKRDNVKTVSLCNGKKSNQCQT